MVKNVLEKPTYYFTNISIYVECKQKRLSFYLDWQSGRWSASACQKDWNNARH